MRISVFKPLALMVVTLALITTLAILLRLAVSLMFSAPSVSATGGGCHPVDKFVTKSHDSTSEEVNFDFQSGDHVVVISADPGYTITEVWLDVESDGHSGYFKYGTGPGTYNPNPGNDIESAKVRVIKSCPSPSPSPSPSVSPSPSPSPSPSVSPSPSTEPSPSEEPTPTESPLPTATPVDVCTNLDGIQSAIPDGYYVNTDSTVCLQFQYGGPQPPSGGAGGQVLGTSQVLGASTLGATGTFESEIFSALFALGASLIGVGIRKKATIKSS